MIKHIVLASVLSIASMSASESNLKPQQQKSLLQRIKSVGWVLNGSLGLVITANIVKVCIEAENEYSKPALSVSLFVLGQFTAMCFYNAYRANSVDPL